jgi:starvation-inducible DNA-binding protein
MNEQAAHSIPECLNQVFADIWKIEFQAYSIHWNLRDCPFLAVHEWTQKIYEDLAGYKDELAERIRQLEGYPLGNLSSIIQWSGVTDLPLPSEKDVVFPLFAGNLARCIHVVKSCALICQEQQDLVSVDLLTRLLACYEKNLWMTKSQFSMDRVNELRGVANE